MSEEIKIRADRKLGRFGLMGIAAAIGFPFGAMYVRKKRNCRECCECGAEIGPGRTGRRCKRCREKGQTQQT